MNISSTTLRLLGILFSTMLCLFLFTGTSSALSGSEFNPGKIIDDAVFYDSSSIDVQTIQSFLNNKMPSCDTNGTQIHSSGMTRAAYGTSQGYPPPYTCLRDYVQSTPTKSAESGLCNQYNGGTKISSQIIYDVGQACGINPKVLLVLLQKEQSLVSDDWPWSIQYRSATGYGCPDTAPCDAEYYGFFNQVYNAARQYKRYARDANVFSYKAGRVNYIQYNPNSVCGGTDVFLQNQATASLYNYTPYQPNPSALANLYGSGDSCGAYGNRNFWRLFNDWFGSVYLTGPYVAKSSDTEENKLWLMNGSQKYHISNPDILSAWNLTSRKVYTVDKAYLSTLTEMHPLTRLFQDGSTGIAYFVDRGKFYRIINPDQVTLWNFDWADVAPFGNSYAPNYFMQYSGNLAYSFIPENVSSVFMVDGTSVRKILNPTVLSAVGSPAMALSANYYNQYFSGHITGSIDSPVLTDGSTKLFMDGGSGYSINSSLNSLYPSGNNVNAATLRRIAKHNKTIDFFLQDPANGKVYIIDAGQKHWVSNPSVLAGLTSSTRIVAARPSVSLIAEGSPITNTFLRDTSSNKYLVNNGQLRKITGSYESLWLPYTNAANIVSNLFITSVGTLGPELTDKVSLNGKTTLIKDGAAYTTTSQSLVALWGTGSASNVVSPAFVNSVYTKELSSYVKSSDPSNGRIYLKTAAGSLTHIADFNSYTNSLNKNSLPVVLSPDTISGLAPVSKSFSAVKNGSKVYVFDAGKLREVTNSDNTAWQPNSVDVDQSYLNIQLFSTPLASRVLTGADGRIYFIENGLKRWVSSYATYASTYASQGLSKVSQQLINSIPSGTNIP